MAKKPFVNQPLPPSTSSNLLQYPESNDGQEASAQHLVDASIIATLKSSLAEANFRNERSTQELKELQSQLDDVTADCEVMVQQEAELKEKIIALEHERDNHVAEFQRLCELEERGVAQAQTIANQAHVLRWACELALRGSYGNMARVVPSILSYIRFFQLELSLFLLNLSTSERNPAITALDSKISGFLHDLVGSIQRAETYSVAIAGTDIERSVVETLRLHCQATIPKLETLTPSIRYPLILVPFVDDLLISFGPLPSPAARPIITTALGQSSVNGSAAGGSVSNDLRSDQGPIRTGNVVAFHNPILQGSSQSKRVSPEDSEASSSKRRRQ
ncbi:hypothetical protein V5O48_016946 [Marasmius crinis-equi]|uniref:Uncharacterized protein n=1 Tax=Marasmius crinis-equi TaxID=585013 RepID=A0ABR3EQE6_9AGAR